MKNNLLTTTALTCAVGFAAAGLTAVGFAGKAQAGTDVGNGYVGVGASAHMFFLDQPPLRQPYALSVQ